MRLLTERHYLLLNPFIKKFERFSFIPDKGMELFTYKFSVYEYNQMPILFGYITSDLEGNVRLDCRDNNNNEYVHFYNNYYGNADPILKKIFSRFRKAFKELEIVEI